MTEANRCARATTMTARAATAAAPSALPSAMPNDTSMSDSPTSDPILRTGLSLAGAVVLVALAARVDVPVPGSPVPQSLQTLAVVVVGAWLGPVLGASALALYVLVGALGAPVFADGASGIGVLMGPTAGYLVGFVVGAGIAGLWKGRARTWDAADLRAAFLSATALAVAGHLVILGLGWLRLAVLLGAGPAFTGGVAPFLWGGVAKSLVGAGIVVAGRYFTRGR